MTTMSGIHNSATCPCCGGIKLKDARWCELCDGDGQCPSCKACEICCECEDE